VGGQKAISMDVRIIAATNQKLETAVAAGDFREDLYHRLNVMRINTPPLRDRREDIPMLVRHYLEKAAAELGVQAKTINDEALQKLSAFDWPGNVRQLVNAVRRMTVTAPGNEIRTEDLPPEVGGSTGSSDRDWSVALAAWAGRKLSNGATAPLLDEAQPEFERALIRAAMQAAGGRKQDAAKLLGWGRNTLARKIRDLGLS